MLNESPTDTVSSGAVIPVVVFKLPIIVMELLMVSKVTSGPPEYNSTLERLK